MRCALRWWVALLAGLGLGVACEARAVFEDIEVSPRARALGASASALRFDEYAVYHNPASLAWAEGAAGAASYLRPFGYDFSSQSVAAGSISLPRNAGGVALGIRHFGVDYGGRSLTSETTVSLAHGFHLRRDAQSEAAVGWSVNLYSLSYGISAELDQGAGVTRIDPGSATTVGLNLGGMAVIRDRTRIGFYVVNLNNARVGRRDHEDLPRHLFVGVSYAPYPGVETVLDIANQLGAPIEYRGGAEFEINEWLRLRAGIHTEPSVFTAGLGLNRSGMRLDYGFSTGGGVLGETHHLGIGYSLRGEK